MVNKTALLKDLNETSFAINDLTLYLDTHPNCNEGLQNFAALKQRRKDILAEFEKNYYPMTVDCISNVNNGVWPWANTPAPWEGCGNNVEL